MTKTIYLDNAATTPIDKQVLNAMLPYFKEKYGNASSLHHKGQEAKQSLDKAKQTIAKSINAQPDEIIFTSGGTESNNLAIKGIVYANSDKKHIITTKIEHDCILNACKWLQNLDQEYKITYLNVDQEGFINIKELEDAIRPDTILVSIIHGNNEIGTIQDLEKIGKLCKTKGVYFHTDACQSFTKTEIDVQKMNIDLMTINSHKIYGPKGVGALYIKSGIKINPLMHGGGQEKNKRSGTENIAGIIGFAKAVEIGKKQIKNSEKMEKLRDYMIKKILEIPETKLNGSTKKKRLCNNINISFSKIEGESIAAMLDLSGICVSTGSACSSKSLDPSHVIMALENNSERAHGSIRFSLSKYTKKSEIDYTIKEVKKTVESLRKISPLTHTIK